MPYFGVTGRSRSGSAAVEIGVEDAGAAVRGVRAVEPREVDPGAAAELPVRQVVRLTKNTTKTTTNQKRGAGGVRVRIGDVVPPRGITPRPNRM